MTPHPEWSEELLLGVTSVLFRGENQERRDELDIASFGRAAKTPADDDLGGHALIGNRRGFTPERGIMFAGALVIGATTWMIATAVSPNPTGEVGDRINIAAVVAFFLALIILPLGRLALTRTPPHVSTDESFRISVGPDRILVQGDSTYLDEATSSILAFETTNRRLQLVRRDGARVTLPCVLTSRRHAPLVARLNELLAVARAGTGGYR